MKHLCFILLMMFVACGDGSAEKIRIIGGQAQGSTYAIKYISSTDDDLKPSIDSILEVIDLSMSTYRPESIISKINRGENVKIDKHFEKVFLASQQIWQQSQGLFDPTVGVLVNAWGFGKDKNHKILNNNQIDSLKQFVGFEKVVLTQHKHIVKDNTSIYFDFNAIAQGYTVDVIANYLKNRGIENFVVEVGGEIFASGKNIINDKNWVIGVENPLLAHQERELLTAIELENQGLATSGNYRKVRTDTLTGEKYVHSINPKTGKATQSNLLSATVITDTAMYADAYATMFMVMGLEQSKLFLEKHTHLKAMLVFNNSDNRLEIFTTEGFKKLQKD